MHTDLNFALAPYVDKLREAVSRLRRRIVLGLIFRVGQDIVRRYTFINHRLIIVQCRDLLIGHVFDLVRRRPGCLLPRAGRKKNRCRRKKGGTAYSHRSHFSSLCADSVFTLSVMYAYSSSFVAPRIRFVRRYAWMPSGMTTSIVFLLTTG